MSQYGWKNCPDTVRTQIISLLDPLQAILEDSLVGIYLHGSLAMGCFNPERSDIDLLVVTRQGMPTETKRQVAELLLRSSKAPRPIEISFVVENDLHALQHPMPLDLHYSEDWREKYQEELSSGTWKKWNERPLKDPDLAAQLTALSHRGICLFGRPIQQVIPPVPEEYYITSIVGDFNWARERMDKNPVYFVLNACRVYAYLLENRIFSKDEAGAWALRRLPKGYQDLVAQALDTYRGQLTGAHFDKAILARFARYMHRQINEHIKEVK